MQSSIVSAILAFASLAQAAPGLAARSTQSSCGTGQSWSFLSGKCSCTAKTWVMSADGKSCSPPAGAAAGSGGVTATAVAPALPAAKTLGADALNSANLNDIVMASIGAVIGQSSVSTGGQGVTNMLSPTFYSQCCSYFNTTTVQSNYIDQTVVAGLLAHSDLTTWSSATALTSNSKYLGSNTNVAGAMIASYCNDDTCRPRAGTYDAYTLCPTGLGQGSNSICKVSLSLSTDQITAASKSATASASQGWSANFAQYVTWSYTSTVASSNSISFLCIGSGGITTAGGVPVSKAQ